MMIARRYSVCFLLVVSTVAWAGSDESVQSWFAGKYRHATVSEQQLIDSPEWSSENGEPPIGAGKAIQLAEPVFNRLKKELDGAFWMLESATLVPANQGNPDEMFTNDRWYWVIWYQMYPEVGGGNLPYIQLIVLMDGSVIQPKDDPAKHPTSRPPR